jgi:peptidoglycan/LPS O-acetylase OafA/YrhL
MVVLYHIGGYVLEKSSTMFVSGAESLGHIFSFGHQGVQLFFVISGFILAMPFMRASFGLTTTKPSLRRYFLRRVTRLEPPYIVSTVVLFILLVTVIGRTPEFGALWKSLLASLAYLHNFVFPGQFPRINPVTWSLEIEIQFYLAAPFLVLSLCSLRNKTTRRILIVALMTFSAILSWLLETAWRVEVLSIANFLQYFLAGILLCDIYLLDANVVGRRLNRMIFAGSGAILLLVITTVEHAQTPQLSLKIVSPFIILAFYLITFGNGIWNKIFSLNVLTLIGGMCYTIYLWHYAVISAVGRVAIRRLFVSDFYLYFTIQVLVYTMAILAVSAVFFLAVEKPCMRPDWHLRLVDRVSRHFPKIKAREKKLS